MSPAHSLRGTYSAELADVADLVAIRQEWNALIDGMQYPSVFCGWEWTSTWWEVFGAERDMRALKILRNGELRGILPIYLSRSSTARQARVGRVLSHSTAADLNPDPLDIVSAEHDAAACCAAALDYLRRSTFEWDVLHLRYLAEDAFLLQVLSSAAEYHPHIDQVSVAPYVQIAGTYEDYLGELSANERSNVRRRRRKLIDGQGAVYTDFRSEDPQKVLDALFELHEKRASEKRIDSSFAGKDVKAFIRALLPRLGHGSVWLRGIRHRGETIAAFLGFVAGARVSYYQLGYNPAWSEFSPGSVLLQETIREAFDSGLTEYNFLQGGEAFKYRWAHRARRLYAVDLFNRSFCGRLSRSLRAARSMLMPSELVDAPTPATGNP